VTTRHIPCTECGGTGRVLWSRYGGNDPDVVDKGPCEYCDGTGQQRCSECAEFACDAWIEPGNSDYAERVYPLCATHMRLYAEAAAE